LFSSDLDFCWSFIFYLKQNLKLVLGKSIWHLHEQEGISNASMREVVIHMFFNRVIAPFQEELIQLLFKQSIITYPLDEGMEFVA
jgi:hypothetical protein